MGKSRIAIVIALCLAAVTFTMCCKQTKSTADAAGNKFAAGSQKGEIKQGVKGRVEVWEGNFMPMVDKNSSNNKITPGAGRRVRLHEPVKAGGIPAAKRETIPTPVIAEVMADSAGRFVMAAAPGTYSIFVEDSGGWYNNGWNDQGIQGAVTVKPDSVTEVLVKITTKATF
jgi:hypothetical protein